MAWDGASGRVDDEFDCEVVYSAETFARSPEWWARAVFEGAPTALRCGLPVAWRLFLRARLGPASSPEHVLGMPIVRSEPDVVVLELPSSLLSAHNVVSIGDRRVRLTTRVRYDRAAGRWVWTLAGVIHARVAPYLLRRALRRAEASA